jgi:hypothetical protein
MLVHALSDLGAKRSRKHGLKLATRAAQWGRRTVFFWIQHGAVLIKIGNFAEFQFSPPTSISFDTIP